MARFKPVREVRIPDGVLTINDIEKHLEDGEFFSFFERPEGWIGELVPFIRIYKRIEHDKNNILNSDS